MVSNANEDSPPPAKGQDGAALDLFTSVVRCSESPPQIGSGMVPTVDLSRLAK